MTKMEVKQYGLYLLRWQLSTPILAACLYVLEGMNSFWATVIANLIGGLMFYWVDKVIFRKKETKSSSFKKEQNKKKNKEQNKKNKSKKRK